MIAINRDLDKVSLSYVYKLLDGIGITIEKDLKRSTDNENDISRVLLIRWNSRLFVFGGTKKQHYTDFLGFETSREELQVRNDLFDLFQENYNFSLGSMLQDIQ